MDYTAFAARAPLRRFWAKNSWVLPHCKLVIDRSTTVHIDGIYQPRPTTGYQDMFDIERLELLRGPQGVLFGRNSTGGTLNIITKMPGGEFSPQLLSQFKVFERLRPVY